MKRAVLSLILVFLFASVSCLLFACVTAKPQAEEAVPTEDLAEPKADPTPTPSTNPTKQQDPGTEQKPDPTSDPAPSDPAKTEPTRPDADDPEEGNDVRPTDPEESTPGLDDPSDPIPGDPDPVPTEPICEHVFGAWSIDPEPSCEEPGLRRRVCSECGKEETEDLPALGHLYVGKVCSRCGAPTQYGEYYGEESVTTTEGGTIKTRPILSLNENGRFTLMDQTVSFATYESLVAAREGGDYVVTVREDTQVSTGDFTKDGDRYVRVSNATTMGVIFSSEEVVVIIPPEFENESDYTATYSVTIIVTRLVVTDGAYTHDEDFTLVFIDDDTYALSWETESFSVVTPPEECVNSFRFGAFVLTLRAGEYDGVSTFSDVATALFAEYDIEIIGSHYSTYGYRDGYPVENFTIPTEEEPLAENATYDLCLEPEEGYGTMRVSVGDSTKIYVALSSDLAACSTAAAYAELLALDDEYAYILTDDGLLAVKAVYRTATREYADTEAGDGQYRVKTYEGITTWYGEDGATYRTGDALQNPTLSVWSYRYALTAFDGEAFTTTTFMENAPVHATEFAPDGYAFVRWEINGETVEIGSLPVRDGEIDVVAVYEKRTVTLAPTETNAGVLRMETYRGEAYSQREESIPVLTDETYEKTVETEPTLVTRGRILYESETYGAYVVERYRAEQTFTYDGKEYVVSLNEETGIGTVVADGETLVAPIARDEGALILSSKGRTLVYAASVSGGAFRIAETDVMADKETLGLAATADAVMDRTYRADDGIAYAVGENEGVPVILRDGDVVFSIDEIGVCSERGVYCAEGSAYRYSYAGGTVYFAEDERALPDGEEIAAEDILDKPARRLTGETLVFHASEYALNSGSETVTGGYVRADELYYLYDGVSDAFCFRFTLGESGIVVSEE